MKKEKTKMPTSISDKKQLLENPEKGSGRQDREQSRTKDIEASDYGDDFSDNADLKNPKQESATFEQDVKNEQYNDPERLTQKRTPVGEDPLEIAKQGKKFEPGKDEVN